MTELSGFAALTTLGVCTGASIEPRRLGCTNLNCYSRFRRRLLQQPPLNSAAQAADAFAKQVRRYVREVEPHRVRAAVIRVEALTGYEGDLFFDRFEQQLARVDVR